MQISRKADSNSEEDYVNEEEGNDDGKGGADIKKDANGEEYAADG